MPCRSKYFSICSIQFTGSLPSNFLISLFLDFKSLILKRLWICNFRSPISEIWFGSNPLSPLSNPEILIKIGFYKEALCQISHDDLIIDWFSRANLYEVSRVTVSTLGPETNIQKTTVRPLSLTFYKISIWCSEKKLWQCSQGHLFSM